MFAEIAARAVSDHFSAGGLVQQDHLGNVAAGHVLAFHAARATLREQRAHNVLPNNLLHAQHKHKHKDDKRHHVVLQRLV